MTLISLLIALALERLVGYMSDFRRPALWLRYANGFDATLRRLGLGHAALRLLLVLLVPVLVVGWVSDVFDSVLLGLLWIVFSVAVLLVCLGPDDLEEDVNAYTEAVAMEDPLRQWRIAARFLGAAHVPEEPRKRARAVAESAFAESNNRIFAVVFWFAVLGPTGAVFYRLVRLLAHLPLEDEKASEVVETDEDEDVALDERPESSRLAAGLCALLEWAPARLAALGYAVTGSFDHAMDGLRSLFWGESQRMSENTRALLMRSGAGAARLDDMLEDEADAATLSAVFATVINHIHRNIIVWMAVLALFTLGGWLT
ncbi:MAG: regulatory signaling modulator protein AmpE [Acidihalobacter sp.]|jgi:AmpE protein|uniref:regulatory signaling modulator protein AmpE n=1 Tax=Acidihalobacter sp. TaxID=1872108 RepID=UPI00307FA6B2